MNKGIVVAGSIILDKHFFIDTYPQEGCLVQVRDTSQCVGGAGNLILDLAMLDASLPVKVCAVIGKGSNGRSLRAKLKEYENIDLTNLVEEGNTPITLVMDSLDSKQRTFFFFPGSCDFFDESYINWDTVQGEVFQLEYLLLMKKVDGIDAEYGTHGARILAEAKKRGMKTSIDMVSEKSKRVSPIVSAALRYTDYCTINEIEAEAVSELPLTDKEGKVQEDMIPQVLMKLCSFGVSTWIIIHSAKCCYGYDCRKKSFFKALSLQLPPSYIKGTTGAGDAFCSGVLYTIYNGGSIFEAMQLGNACAACSLSCAGGTEGMRSYQEVRKVFEQYKGDSRYEEIGNQ